MTEIEKHIREYYDKQKEYFDSLRRKVANGELMSWDDALKVQESDKINFNGRELEITYLAYQSDCYGLEKIYFQAKYIDVDGSERKMTGRLAVNVPDNDDYMYEFDDSMDDFITFSQENFKSISDFFEKNKDNDVYNWQNFVDDSFDKKKVDPAAIPIARLAFEFIKKASRLYKGKAGDNGAFIRFIDDDARTGLIDGCRNYPYIYNDSHLHAKWWLKSGWLDKIDIIRQSTTRGHLHYDNFNINADAVIGIDIQIMDGCSGKLSVVCLCGDDGYYFEPFTNPMRMAHVAVVLMSKIKKDFNIEI